MRCLLALGALLAVSGCVSPVNMPPPTPAPMAFAAVVQSPSSSTIVIPPGQPVQIIIVPAPGVFFTPNAFFNAFQGVNPNLAQFCPGFVNLAAGILGSTPAAPPSIGVTITPTPQGAGNCTLPINLGATGIDTFSLIIQ